MHSLSLVWCSITSLHTGRSLAQMHGVKVKQVVLVLGQIFIDVAESCTCMCTCDVLFKKGVFVSGIDNSYILCCVARTVHSILDKRIRCAH